MTATGSHEYFYSLRGAQPPGEALTQKYGAGCTGEAKAPPGVRLAPLPGGFPKSEKSRKDSIFFDKRRQAYYNI